MVQVTDLASLFTMRHEVVEMSAVVVSAIDLPDPFRPADVLGFHGRDPSGVAEAVGPDQFRKGFVWRDFPACLTLRFGGRRAHAELQVDAPLLDGDEPALTQLVRRMLGLTQSVDAFEETYRHHPQVGRLIAQNPGLRLPVAPSPFEALTWAVTGQQISVGAALSLRRKLIQAAGIRHSGGLFCYPDAAAVLRLRDDDLRQAGFSRTKAKTLREVSQRVVEAVLPLDHWLQTASMPTVGERLLETPGIGPWTVSYALLRGYGWLDGSLHGDVAVRRNLQSLLGASEKLDEREAERWLAPFRPWRALVAAHLWAWDRTVA
jgi:DNA-3-methyladenine glycosylase II